MLGRRGHAVVWGRIGKNAQDQRPTRRDRLDQRQFALARARWRIEPGKVIGATKSIAKRSR